MAYTTIDDPSAYFQTTLYTGSGSSTQNVVNGGNSDLQPDWVWVKNRTDARWHRLVDSSRGASKNLYSNETDAEGTEASVTAFNSDGFSLGTDTGSDGWNEDGDAHVAWQWKANGGTESGSFSEAGTNPAVSFQANTTAGFSICTYTGTGGNGSFAHGLGVAPKWIIVKGRDVATDGMVYHGANTSAPETDALTLPETSATSDNAGWWQDTAPTSSSVYIGTHDRVNKDGNLYVAYCFAEKQGYSKFGSYTGNGNANGPFVYTGFKPAWLMIKETVSGGGWGMWDNKRTPTNAMTIRLLANTNAADDTSTDNSVDFLSNGFKMRTSSGGFNQSSTDIVYLAFAESPFVSSKGVPTPAE